MFLSIIENGNPQGKFRFVRETFFWVVFSPEGSAFTSRAKRGLVKKDPEGKKATQKKVCLTKRNFPVGFAFSIME